MLHRGERIGLLQPAQIAGRRHRYGEHAGIPEQEDVPPLGAAPRSDGRLAAVAPSTRPAVPWPQPGSSVAAPAFPLGSDTAGATPRGGSTHAAGSHPTSACNSAVPVRGRPTTTTGRCSGVCTTHGRRRSSSRSSPSVTRQRTSSLRSQARPNGVSGACARSASSARRPGSSATKGRPSRRDTLRRTSCSSRRPSDRPARSSVSRVTRATALTQVAGRIPSRSPTAAQPSKIPRPACAELLRTRRVQSARGRRRALLPDPSDLPSVVGTAIHRHNQAADMSPGGDLGANQPLTRRGSPDAGGDWRQVMVRCMVRNAPVTQVSDAPTHRWRSWLRPWQR